MHVGRQGKVDYIIVRPDFQPYHPVDLFGSGGQHDDGQACGRGVLAEPAALRGDL